MSLLFVKQKTGYVMRISGGSSDVCSSDLLGVGFGMLIAYNIDVIVPFIERLLGVQFLPQQIYFISELPSNPQLADIAVVAATSLVLSLLATLYPSWRASTLQHAQVLRHD